MTENPPLNDPRLAAAAAWLKALAIDAGPIEPASEDASFRRYFRFTLGHDWQAGSERLAAGTSLILMDAPPAQEDSEPFVRVAETLARVNVPAPRIYRHDLSQGFLLLSDLGSQLLLTLLERSPLLADTLYLSAGDILHRLQAEADPAAAGLPDYDEALLRRELALFSDWLCRDHLGQVWSDDDQTHWRVLCDRLVANALQQPQTFVHRDYHSRNLMVSDDLDIALIDFQDAVRGPFTYDVVSLLRDCYIEWPLAQIEHWALRWLDHSPLCGDYDQTQLLRWFYLMGVQRHLKAAGIFARLGIRDGKWHYLNDVPRTLGYITPLAARYPELEWLCALIEQRCLPALA